MENDDKHPDKLSRRTLFGAAVLGIGGASFLAEDQTSAQPIKKADPAFTAPTTEGPYYLELDLMRADITEGLPGIPIDIAITVLDEDAHPHAGALVDVWHCDAQGNYSGFEQPSQDMRGRTFLRGTQRVDADGRALFHSIYPGWYPGRTTHIHFKVRNGSKTNLTSQFFLPDALSEFLYTQVSAYQRDELRDTLNSSDGIAIEAGPSVEGSVHEGPGRYVVMLTVRVDKRVDAPIDRPPALGPDQLPPAPPPMPSPLQGSQRSAALLPNAPRLFPHPEPWPRQL